MYQLLSGLSIVEVSSFVASPTAGLYCAQMGAEVIRIDDRRGGLDYKRYMMTREGRSLSWENLNRAKKSVALDLQTPEGRELAVELARKVGQVITNLPLESFNILFTAKAEWDEGLAGIRSTTLAKLRQVLFRMMREASVISEDGRILSAYVSPQLKAMLAEKSPRDLAVFPGLSREGGAL